MTLLDLEIKNCTNKKILYWVESNHFMMYLQKMLRMPMVILRIMVLLSVMIRVNLVYFKFPQVYSTIQKGKGHLKRIILICIL